MCMNKKHALCWLLALTLVIASFAILGFYVSRAYGSPSYEDFTQYYEFDPNSHLDRNATYINHTACMYESAGIYDNKTANHFGNFEHLIEVYWDTSSSEALFLRSSTWMLSNTPDKDGYYHKNNNLDYMAIQFHQTVGDEERLWLVAHKGSAENSTYAVITEKNWYYLTIARSESNAYCEVRTGSHSNTTLHANLTIDCWTIQFQYIYASSSWNSGHGARYITHYVRNFDLQEGDDPPTYDNLTHNTTFAGEQCLFSCEWSDDKGLSEYKFDWKNGTANWINGSWTDPWTGTPTSGWSNVTKTLNHTAGATIQYVFYGKDNASQITSTGVQSFSTGALWWDKLVCDAQWGWRELLRRAEDFSSYGNLTPTYHCDTGVGDELFAFLLEYSLSMYRITNNETYLDYARDTCNDMFTYMQHGTTKLVGRIDRSTGSIVDTEDLSIQYLTSVAELALLDSSYIDELNELANAIILYHFENNSGGYSLPIKCQTDGDFVSNQVYWQQILEKAPYGFLWAYYVTGNTTYLNWARGVITDFWETRHPTTQIIPNLINVETRSANHPVITKGAEIGSFIKGCAFYYLFDQNSTIYEILNTESKVAVDYYFNGYDSWRYYTYTDGTNPSGTIEGNEGALTAGMVMSYEIVGNSTFLNRAIRAFNSSVQEEEHLINNDLFIHATTNFDSHMPFEFSHFPASYELLFLYDGIVAQGTATMYTCYNQTVRKHSPTGTWHQGKYGYKNKISSVNFNNVSSNFINHNPFLGWIQWGIRPSGCNITWSDLPNGEAHSTVYCKSICAEAHMFINVTFDYENQKILFDEIKGSGTVTFNQTIISAKRDGVTYANFTNNILNTTTGSHSYEVWFIEAEVEFSASITINTATHTWTLNPGDSDVLINENYINITVTANKAYTIQAKGNASLTNIANGWVIGLGNVTMNSTGSPISLTTSYQNVPGLVNQASGTDMEHLIYLYLTCPLGTRDGDYVYTLYIKVIEYTG